MRRVFKTRHFARWMRKTEVTDAALCKAVSEMAEGLVDADLGGCVVKKRVALAGRGKRGGARTLVATRRAGRWFFMFGFEKSQRADVAPAELGALQGLAAAGLSPAQALAQINRLIDQQAYTRAADDIFLGSATVFLLLIGTIWLTERPARHAGAGAVDAGGAH